jgi:hypothetical protein
VIQWRERRASLTPMHRLAVAFVATALGGTVTACGGPTGDPPQHFVATTEPSSLDFHASMAALERVRTTTTSTTAAPVVPPRPPAARPSRGAAGPRPRAVAGDVWTALARCESGMRNDPGAPYYGYFQFSASTWRSLGYGGLPTDYDYATQLAAAQRLVARSGWGQFPACARKLGLR